MLVVAAVAVLSCEEKPSFSAGPRAPQPLACLGADEGFASAARVPFFAREGRRLLDFGTTTSTPTIVGTDHTSRYGFAIDYGGRRIHRAEEGAFCSDAALTAAGLSPLPSTGFFAKDRSKLRPLADVVDAAPAGVTVANVPTVPVSVAGIAAHAQIDTGFDDAVVPFSVNVNEALLAAVLARRPNALVRAPEKDLSLTTCAGVREAVTAYALAPGASFDLVDAGGRTVRPFRTATIFVKRTPEAARRCGGIGTWSVPAAQIGTSFLVELGLVVFDPFRSVVWVK